MFSKPQNNWENWTYDQENQNTFILLWKECASSHTSLPNFFILTFLSLPNPFISHAPTIWYGYTHQISSIAFFPFQIPELIMLHLLFY